MPLSASAADPTKVRLSRAALELFAERGFHGTGIRDIAVRAGVSTSGLYQYVRSKGDALTDLITDGLTRHCEALDAVYQSVERVEERLVALVSVQVVVPVRHRAMSRLLHQELPLHDWTNHPQVSVCHQRIQRLWGSVLTQGLAEGAHQHHRDRFGSALPRVGAAPIRWLLPRAGSDVGTAVVQQQLVREYLGGDIAP